MDRAIEVGRPSSARYPFTHIASDSSRNILLMLSGSFRSHRLRHASDRAKRSGSAPHPLCRPCKLERKMLHLHHGLLNPGVRRYPHLPFQLQAPILLHPPALLCAPFSSSVELIGTRLSSERKPRTEDGLALSQIPRDLQPGGRDLLDSCFVMNIALSRFADSSHIFKLHPLGQISKGFRIIHKRALDNVYSKFVSILLNTGIQRYLLAFG